MDFTDEMNAAMDKLEKKGFEMAHVSHQGWVMMTKTRGCSTWMGQVDRDGYVNGETAEEFLAGLR